MASITQLLGTGVSNSVFCDGEAIRTKHGSIEFVTQIVNIFYMTSSFSKSICCCFWQTETEADPVYDETTRLIPEEPAIDMYVLPNLYVLMGIVFELIMIFFVLWFLVQLSTKGSISDSAK